MKSPPLEARAEALKSEPAVAPIRYPTSTTRYLLSSLLSVQPRERVRPTRTVLAMARPRRMTRGARAVLGWVFFWYVVGQLAMLLWIDDSWLPNRVRVERDKWKQMHERIAEAPDRSLILMLGSSRTDWAFQAGRLSGRPGPDGHPLLAYNLGVPTTGPLHEALYLNDLLDEGIRPRLLLVEFVATHLNQSRRGILSEERFTIAHWLNGHQVRFLRPYLSNSRRATVEWLETRVAPCYGFRWSIHEHLQGKHALERPWDQARRPMDAWGCRLLFDDPNTPLFRARRWVGAFEMYGETLRRFRVGAGPLKAMHDLLARCRRERIPVALVVMPVTKAFEGLYNPEGRAELTNALADLSERYGTEIIDGRDWLDIEDFDDGHHVIRSGAHKFTGRMIEEVQKILARIDPPDEPRTTP